MSVDSKQRTPAFDPQLLNQLLAGKKTAGEIEDLRKAFIEQTLQGELTHLLGYEKHSPEGHHSGNSRNGSSRTKIKASSPPFRLTCFGPHLPSLTRPSSSC
jgi:transposase-like protein